MNENKVKELLGNIIRITNTFPRTVGEEVVNKQATQALALLDQPAETERADIGLKNLELIRENRRLKARIAELEANKLCETLDAEEAQVLDMMDKAEEPDEPVIFTTQKSGIYPDQDIFARKEPQAEAENDIVGKQIFDECPYTACAAKQPKPQAETGEYTEKVRKRWKPEEKHMDTTLDYALSELYRACDLIDSLQAELGLVKMGTDNDQLKISELEKKLDSQQAELKQLRIIASEYERCKADCSPAGMMGELVAKDKRIAELEHLILTPECFNDLRLARLRIEEFKESGKALLALVGKQAEDEGLWAEALPLPNIVESYLQQELRKLHAAIETNFEALTKGGG